MKYGIHTKLVEEVIQFANSMQDFQKTMMPEGVNIINSIDEVKELAFYKVFGEDEYTWSDIRQKEMAKVKGKLYRLDPNEKPKGLDEVTEEIANGLRNQITDSYRDFFEDVVVDLRNCAINRAINGQNQNFYEQIFNIYKAGGFPCGWKGEYPEIGEIIAYFK
ncbi:hypothetical protein HPB58_06920 [Priestia filamentosa]|uniref:hypothetical protein n=1 Tax=Priestia filamentosa TaxID=1402861 RepID=UPI001FB45AD1|nr:hypothetical protein [Priestia filamentosa]UOE61898.1 hypothetical protein HPB58_06920 [Priestia filamentosa]